MKMLHTLYVGTGHHFKPCCGWAEPKYHWYSMIVSANLLLDRFGNAHLSADKKGAVAARRLGIPYTSITEDLEGCVWNPIMAGSKMRTYGLQNEPFIHIDLDAFLFKPLPSHIMNAPAAFQDIEGDGGRYAEKAWRELNSLPVLPTEWKDAGVQGYNMGFVLCNDIASMKNYVAAADMMMDKRNDEAWSKLGDRWRFNWILEQGLIYPFFNKGIEFLLPEVRFNDGKSYLELTQGSKSEMAHNLGYCHALGLKSDGTTEAKAFRARLEKQCKRDYPKQYAAVAEALAEVKPMDILGSTMWKHAHLTPNINSEWLKAWEDNISCDECRGHWEAIKKEHPPDFGNMRQWFFDRHNDVNARLGKSVVTYEQAARLYNWKSSKT